MPVSTLINMTAPYNEAAAATRLTPALWFGVRNWGERFTTYRVTNDGPACRVWCLHAVRDRLVQDEIDMLDGELAERLGDGGFWSFPVPDLPTALSYLTAQGRVPIQDWRGGSYHAHSWRYTGVAPEGASAAVASAR